jgi:23S rRNA (cytidine1920-2'-O)/16S rRNA (cytidine1409-2'-O)-methyltransferase
MSKSNKIRLDQLLLDRELVPSRSNAKSLIMAGKVLINEEVVDKAGTLVSVDVEIRMKESLKFVGRGGLKLEQALKSFDIATQDKTCADIGASTGGFSDCLLQNGAKKIYAIDVGYGQLHWKLVKDERVVSMERQNFRHFDLDQIKEPIDLIVMDVSFISILKLLPKIQELFQNMPPKTKPQQLVALIKPQFEAGPGQVGKGGIVRDEAVRNQVIDKIKTALVSAGFSNLQITPSPITGADGNIEFLIGATWNQ